MKNNEIYISVDVETSGPVPGEFSLLSVGACLVHNPTKSVYIELQPDSLRHDAESLAVTGLNLEHLQQHGLHPVKAMEHLSEWINTVKQPEMKIIFVGLNAPFDWSFINYYFHKYLGGNPFGFTAIDIKAYYMGFTGCSWSETKSSLMAKRLSPITQPSHNALDDAKFQAELFALMTNKEQKGC
ncbi:3'-5' exonuclease [Morganella morganii]|uniref:3'-5' exonuclease n=1 Tax=Morganella morganii TaxID=582 RepID=UPI001BDB8E0A|nr:3'-5' exonuclease [Morganella morganii]MBT0461659.1 3'-5' exonuclease [Morganella morganii subsp. morganii]